MTYEYLKGTLVERAPGRAVLEVGGIGYAVHTPLLEMEKFPAPGTEIRLWVHHHVNENERAFYGFFERDDRDIFTMLLSVSGIGPKLAMKAMAATPPKELAAAIAGGQTATLRRVKGLGEKIAAKMILELKEKAGAFALPSAPGSEGATRSSTEMALRGLGFAEAEIRKVCDAVFANGTVRLEDAIRQALRLLGPG